MGNGSCRGGTEVSRENIELVRRLVDAFNERDAEEFAQVTTDDFEWSTSVMAVEGEIFLGREGIETYFSRMRDAWDEFKAEIDSYRDLGERVLISGQIEARGRGSGAPVAAPLEPQGLGAGSRSRRASQPESGRPCAGDG